MLPVTMLLCAPACGGASNGEVCDVGDDCSSEYCFTETPGAPQGVCQDPPAECTDDITCDCPAIGSPCPGGNHVCVAQTKSGVTIACQ
jgi:hypothetical protein